MSTKKIRRKVAPAPGQTVRSTAVAAFLERHSAVLALALVALASLRIVATYPVFSHTFDEPAHLACGMEWLDRGVYQYEAQHPPLARVMAALGPYLLGARSQGTPHNADLAICNEGARILFHNQRYDLTLEAARLGILPFFWVACLVVYVWGRRYLDRGTAVVAVFLFSFLPPVLAHAGLATTDMALTAFLGAAFLSGVIWAESPTRTHGLMFGVCMGFAMLSKFSALAFFPVSVALALVWYLAAERPRPAALWSAVRERFPTFLLAVASACLLIWAGYRFSFGKVDFANLSLPAPELYRGIQEVLRHNAKGHGSYLLGNLSETGFWYFYPVALAVKTPLAFLLLLGAGFLLPFRKEGTLRRVGLPLAFAGGVLLVGLGSRINIGIRHVLPVYLGFSLAAAAEVQRLYQTTRSRWTRLAVPLLLAWFAGSSLVSHPDYLAYFNELAGSEPEKILVDSDLDWGQDAKRLAARLRELGAREVTYLGPPGQFHHLLTGMPPLRRTNMESVITPPPGWSATGATIWKEARFGLYDRYPGAAVWPDRYQPGERIGKSMFLWYFPVAGAR